MEKPYVLGLDIGGTNSVIGIVDARGHVLARTSIKTKEYENINDYITALYNETIKITDPLGGMNLIRGIGIGAPNANYYNGRIENAPNLPWHGIIPLADLMKKRFDLPCNITNDANAAALGEMTYGVARGMKDFIMITLGTGVGSGIVIDGKVVYGHDGFAGELGHTVIDRSEKARPCGCGGYGHLEAYTSATGVTRTAKELLQNTNTPSILRSLDINTITSKDIYEAAEKNDKMAIEIFEFTGKLLGEKFADFVCFSAPEAIILFGGLSKAGQWIMDPIKQSMEERLMGIWKGKIKLLLSDLKEADAAILGASSLAWELPS